MSRSQREDHRFESDMGHFIAEFVEKIIMWYLIEAEVTCEDSYDSYNFGELLFFYQANNEDEAKRKLFQDLSLSKVEIISVKEYCCPE